MTDDKTDPAAVPPKKEWESPQINSGQLFESNSLACGKAMGEDQDMCQGNFQNS